MAVLGDVGSDRARWFAGELNAGHVYVGSSPELNRERVDNGLIGEEIVADSGVYRID